MKKRWSTILLILVLLAGASLLLYPTLSEVWNRHHQSRAIVSYAALVSELENEEYTAILKAAHRYNDGIEPGTLNIPDEMQLQEYRAQLDPTGSGVMGYIDIPSIQCSLPLYHGTSESILTAAVGHIEWSSLPVGGESTHCVISGHRGLPSAKLFTRLDELREGDIFMIHVLDETLTYEVDQIRIVLPEDVDALMVTKGEDLCTLVTCTPYGINTHRLLVRGHRVENREEKAAVHVTADAVVVRPIIVFPFAAVPLLVLLLIGLAVSDRRKKHTPTPARRKEEADL